MSVKGFLSKYFHTNTNTNTNTSDTQEQPQQQQQPQPKAQRWFTPSANDVPQIQQQQEPEQPPTSDSAAVFHIFTDGSCPDNGRRGAKGGFGVHVYSDKQSGLDISEPLMPNEQQTNNRGELRAIQAALDLIDKHGSKWYKDHGKIKIWTDSEYCINSLVKWSAGWKRNNWMKRDGCLIQNLDLVRPMYERLSKMPRVSLQHVRAHQDGKKNEFPFDGNREADRLAREGVNKFMTHTSG